MKIFPSRSQWGRWSLPSKAGYLGAWIGGIALFIAIAILILPLIYTVLDWLPRWAIPKADPNRFSVIVARLENDTNRQQERLIIEALKEFEGIQVLALDRTISQEGPFPEEAEKRGYENAQYYLQKSGASVLIWGIILRQGANVVPKLYWTLSQGARWKPGRYGTSLRETQLHLPQVFWSDLAEILRLLVASYYDEIRDQEGYYVADRLPPFIARVQKLLRESINRPNWDPVARGWTRCRRDGP